MKPTMRNALASFVASVLLSACSTNPMKVSLTELGTSSQVEYGAFHKKYMRSMNITGLSLEETPGSLIVDTDRNGLSSTIKWLYAYVDAQDFPDMTNPRVRTGKTAMLVSTSCKIGSTCLTPLEAVSLKENIEKREALIGIIASSEVDIKALQLTKIALDSKKAEEKETLLAAIKQKFIENNKMKDATITNYTDAFAAMESKLRQNIIDGKKELEAIMKSINKPGVIVANWKLEKSLTASGSAPGANGGFSGNKDRYGYVIFINPIQITLELGNDIGTILTEMEKVPHIKTLLGEDNLFFTTYQMRVSELIYSESLQSIIGANIDLKIDELAKTLQPLVGTGISLDTLTNLKAKVSAEYKQYSFSSNQGSLSFRNEDGPLTPNPISFEYANVVKVANKDGGNEEEAKDYFRILNQSRAVINQRVNLNQYLKLFRPIANKSEMAQPVTGLDKKITEPKSLPPILKLSNSKDNQVK